MTRSAAPDAIAPPRLDWVPALDGLRAFAVVGVLLFHLKTKSLFPGGFLGVDLFFVLSGFLITSLLLQEWRGSRSLSLRTFYLRRARRLMPAALLLVASYLLYVVLLDAMGTRRRDASRSPARAGSLRTGSTGSWPSACRPRRALVTCGRCRWRSSTTSCGRGSC